MTTQRELDANLLIWQVVKRVTNYQKDSEQRWGERNLRIGQFEEDGSIRLSTFGYTTRPIVRRAIKLAHKAGMFTETPPSDHEGTQDGTRNLYLSELGRTTAAQVRPVWYCVNPPVLNDEDLSILDSLARTCAYYAENNWDRGVMPLDVGGTNGSHHSASLAKLCANGLADCGVQYPRPPSLRGYPKGSRRYKITEAGQALFETRDAERKVRISARKKT